MEFFIGLIIFAVGLTLVIKTEWYVNNFGRIGFFEQYLGTEGGSRLGYKLVGLFALFIGIISMTGMIGGFMEWLTYPLTKYNR